MHGKVLPDSYSYGIVCIVCMMYSYIGIAIAYYISSKVHGESLVYIAIHSYL